MKLVIDARLSAAAEPFANAFALPDGLIGLADYTHAELVSSPDQFPFLWMRLRGPEGTINFIVLEPGGVIGGYEPEIFTSDVEALGINDPSEAMILNIVTMDGAQPEAASVNLVGPIVVNRRTRIGRQLVIANYSSYDSFHRLVETAEQVAVSA